METKLPIGSSTPLTVSVFDPDSDDTLQCNVRNANFLVGSLRGETSFTVPGGRRVSRQVTFEALASGSGQRAAITARCTDSLGRSAQATTFITVNARPIADSMAIALDENTSRTIDLPARDPDDDALELNIQRQPTHGTLSCTGLRCTYTPEPDFVGADEFSYAVRDGFGGTDTGTVSLTVRSVNEPPQVGPDAFTTREDNPLNVGAANGLLANDSDPNDGDTIRVVDADSTSDLGASVTVNPDGSFSYVPPADANGTDRFSYTVADQDDERTVGAVTIDVEPVNDPPTVVTPLTDRTVDEDASISAIDLSSRFDDVDIATNNDALSFSATSSRPSLVTASTASPTLALALGPNQNGTATITVTATDKAGATAQDQFTLTVEPVNDVPTVANPISDRTVSEDASPVTIDLTGRFADPDIATDGDSLALTVANSRPSLISVARSGQTLTLTPQPDQNGSASVSVTATDQAGEEITTSFAVEVTPVNDPPTPLGNPSLALDEDQASPPSLDVASFFEDPDIATNGDSLAFTIESNSNPGLLTPTLSGRQLDVSLQANQNGSASVTVSATDDAGASATNTVQVNVAPVNDRPTLTSPFNPVTVDEDASNRTVDLGSRFDDVDIATSGDSLSFSASSSRSSLVTTSVSGSTLTLDFQPNQNGSATITVMATDTANATAQGQFDVTVNPVNDPPVARDDATTVLEGGIVVIQVLANDSDIDGGPLSVQSVADPANGTARISGDRVEYTPNSGFTGADSFTYTVSDGRGGMATARVDVTVQPVNSPPDAQDDLATTDEDQSVTIDVLANDGDPDGDPLTLVDVDDFFAEGTAARVGNEVRFDPAPDFNGTTSFSYTVEDDDNAQDTAFVTVTVRPVNDPPQASPDSEVAGAGTAAFTIDVLANDSDPENDPLTIISVDANNCGTFTNLGNEIRYEPPEAAPPVCPEGQADYTISDGKGGIDTSTVTVVVVGTSTPEAVDDTAVTDEDQSVDIPALANDSDPEDDPFSIASTTPPASGTIQLNSDGTITYRPDPNFNGTDQFAYTICDSEDLCDDATVTVTVNPVNDAPSARVDNAQTAQGTPVTIDVLANDQDVDDEALTVQSATSPAHGTVTVNGDGTVTYEPSDGFTGTETFGYTVCDDQGACDDATVTVSVATD